MRVTMNNKRGRVMRFHIARDRGSRAFADFHVTPLVDNIIMYKSQTPSGAAVQM